MKEYKKRQNNREPLHKHQPPPKRKERPKGTTVANRRKMPKLRLFVQTLVKNMRKRHLNTPKPQNYVLAEVKSALKYVNQNAYFVHYVLRVEN